MRTDPARAGFTLVELLVAVALTAATAAVVLTVTTGALNLWRRAQDNFTTDTEALLILDHLGRDFQGALFRSDGNTWLACDGFDSAVAAHGWISAPLMKPAVTPSGPAGAAPAIADARFGVSGVWLRLITTTGGRPVAVGYQVVRRSLTAATPPEPESIRYSLYRSFATGDATFATGYHVYAHDGALLAPNPTHNVGTNVIDFGVWLYRRDRTGALTRIFPISNSDFTHAAATPGDFPGCADVMIRVLTEEGAAIISAMERGLVSPPAAYAGREGEWWWAVAAAHSRVYTRRLEVRGGSR